jgi:hypothetical protein
MIANPLDGAGAALKPEIMRPQPRQPTRYNLEGDDAARCGP